jgi:ribosomal protein L11 methyltransferase
VADGWEQRWREFHRGVAVGRLWIGPPWEQPPAELEPVTIDPGRAFGTGAHATTRLCLELLQQLEPAGTLLDVGCGSGVLAIAAARLGFTPVQAVDVDAAAVEATAANARANGVTVGARLLDALREPLPDADVAVANIALDVVEAVLPRITARTVITSGYLDRDEAAATAHRRVARRTADGWAADLFETP